MNEKDQTNKALRELALSLTEKPDGRVHVITGAPGAGKTYYVSKQKQTSDIVVDVDRICAALSGRDELYGDNEPVLSVGLAARDEIISQIASRKGNWREAYIITTKDADLIARKTGGNIVNINTPKRECIENVMKDDRRQNKDAAVRIIEEWFEHHGQERTGQNDLPKTGHENQ